MLGDDAKHQKIVFEMVKDVQKRNQEQKQDKRSLIQILQMEAPLESQPNVVLDQHASTKNVKRHQTVVRSSMIHVRRNKTAVLIIAMRRRNVEVKLKDVFKKTREDVKRKEMMRRNVAQV